MIDVTVKDKSKMAAAKPEVHISQLLYKIATKFQRLHPNSEVQQHGRSRRTSVNGHSDIAEIRSSACALKWLRGLSSQRSNRCQLQRKRVISYPQHYNVNKPTEFYRLGTNILRPHLFPHYFPEIFLKFTLRRPHRNGLHVKVCFEKITTLTT